LRAGLIFCLARAGKGLGKGKPSTSICRIFASDLCRASAWRRPSNSCSDVARLRQVPPGIDQRRDRCRGVLSVYTAHGACGRTRQRAGTHLGKTLVHEMETEARGRAPLLPAQGATPRENRLSVHRTAWRTISASLAAIAAVALARPKTTHGSRVDAQAPTKWELLYYFAYTMVRSMTRRSSAR
jgi:hypothetical protein